MGVTMKKPALVCISLLLSLSGLGSDCPPEAPPVAAAACAPGTAYPAEEIQDTTVHVDEALSDLRIATDRWPDCYSNETAIRDMFRLEGVAEKSDQDKACALWKWFRILVSSSMGGYCYENAPGAERTEAIVHDPHKIFTVYGHHQCDGLSWAFVPLWRAAGYIAFDECHFGHTIASLRYKDADGYYRFHDFDPQSRFYYWDAAKQIVGTWTMPVTRARVHRHLTAPQAAHTLRTSLRIGETLTRSWENGGYVIQAQTRGINVAPNNALYIKTPEKQNGIFAIAGEELQTFQAPISIGGLQCLEEGSRNITVTNSDGGTALLHASKKGVAGEAVYRFPSPYILIEAECAAELVKGAAGDLCQFSLSCDGGKTWKPIYTMEQTGAATINVPLGRTARLQQKPDAYTAYEFLLKVEFRAESDPLATGLRSLKVTARRELNKRTLPNLRPGENVLRVSAAKMQSGKLLELSVSYSAGGQEHTETRRIAAFPFYFRIDTGAAKDLVLRDYDQQFNTGELRMRSISSRLIDAAGATPDASLPAAEGEAAFAKSSPHPADMTDHKNVKFPESEPLETSGFLPQSTLVESDARKMDPLIEKLNLGSGLQQWTAAEDLGAYPEAIDALVAALPNANGDLTFHLCKALAQIKSGKATKALLEKWDNAPHGAPGTRYIPDVLAAIGDRSSIPALLGKLHEVRFDFRFHIAYALGKLGGPEAIAALKDLADNDPFPAVRELSRELLDQQPK
jgi:hypothetical protein